MQKQPGRIVTDSMIGMKLPDFARHSPRVATVLGHNPGPFTGPGTNTWIVGIGAASVAARYRAGRADLGRPADGRDEGAVARRASSIASC